MDMNVICYKGSSWSNREKKEDRNKKIIPNRMTKMEDTDQPDVCRFEVTMIKAKMVIKKEEWPQRLRALLSGRSLAVYVNRETKDDYDT